MPFYQAKAKDTQVYQDSGIHPLTKQKSSKMIRQKVSKGPSHNIANLQMKPKNTNLPHELAHVVQQAQGRVKPTNTVNGIAINDNAGLEKEADVLGAKALQMQPKVHESRAVANFVNKNKSDLNQGVEFVGDRDDISIKKLQTAMNNISKAKQSEPIQKKENNTGLPDNLKTGIENLSGYSMDDVKVHYNSNKPDQLQAHAYAQGSDIHLASGQERHLPHEAWHVVQQKQGRVKPTVQMKGKVNVNNDAGLEKEADMMGAKASSFNESPLKQGKSALQTVQRRENIIQMFFGKCFNGIAQGAQNLWTAIFGKKKAKNEDEQPLRELGDMEDGRLEGVRNRITPHTAIRMDQNPDQFANDARTKVLNGMSREQLETNTCSTAAQEIYDFLKVGDEKHHVGVRSLTDTLERNMGTDIKLIYKVNLDKLAGHWFTILQHGDRGILFQGYLNTQSIEENLTHGAGSSARPMTEIIFHLRKIIESSISETTGAALGTKEFEQLLDHKQELIGLEKPKKGREQILMGGRMSSPGNVDPNWSIATLAVQ
ncbi:DUF4157 domain-containing protein [uncultured Shewanella sp.]|uniref:eCIS core domain-containing protein n=1 Tax=uncultured Shewanella sp. TaxID=173975 RepID=UPI002610F58E|nr:DUF4157 domain-containing protein [uncultured Shewanella sp.]